MELGFLIHLSLLQVKSLRWLYYFQLISTVVCKPRMKRLCYFIDYSEHFTELIRWDTHIIYYNMWTVIASRMVLSPWYLYDWWEQLALFMGNDFESTGINRKIYISSNRLKTWKECRYNSIECDKNIHCTDSRIVSHFYNSNEHDEGIPCICFLLWPDILEQRTLKNEMRSLYEVFIMFTCLVAASTY